MLVWFSVTPIGTGSGSVSGEVARALDAVQATGISHRTDPSGTLLEGTWEECMAALRAAGDAVLTQAPRVSFVCKFDIRTDKPVQTGADKLASLSAKRGQTPPDPAPDAA
ncbi:MAG TPA: MTH1187 family thiamine-binding protein [Euzebya sp.]|nr:MTH1187 family thiamine-binding protein [Euzebya sp.]